VVAVVACLAVVIIEATVIEVILAAGLVGILIDSFAEKQIRKWKQTRTATGRRRERIAARVSARRRGMSASGRPEGAVFVGGYLTRALAEERVRKARLLELENEEIQDETAPDPGPRLRSITGFALAMPIMAKLGILLVLSSVFLRMGAVTFGGGFVMIPLMEAEVVNARHWLTHQEFADATALGQITPGPVLITATFVGYRVAGTLGALVATVSVFLPSFLMTIAAGSSLRRFRSNEAVQSFLMGVTPAVVGLLVAAALSMGRAGIHSWIGLTLTGICIFVLVRFKPNAFWLILGAGVARYLIGLVLW
jgi:chromate transporter